MCLLGKIVPCITQSCTQSRWAEHAPGTSGVVDPDDAASNGDDGTTGGRWRSTTLLLYGDSSAAQKLQVVLPWLENEVEMSCVLLGPLAEGSLAGWLLVDHQSWCLSLCPVIFCPVPVIEKQTGSALLKFSYNWIAFGIHSFLAEILSKILRFCRSPYLFLGVEKNCISEGCNSVLSLLFIANTLGSCENLLFQSN